MDAYDTEDGDEARRFPSGTPFVNPALSVEAVGCNGCSLPSPMLAFGSQLRAVELALANLLAAPDAALRAVAQMIIETAAPCVAKSLEIAGA